MRDYDQYREERKERWKKMMERRSPNSHIWTGVFLMLIGIVALIKISVTDVPDWVFSWQMLLIALGAFIGIRHGFRGAAWFILMLVGGVFLIRDIYPELTFRNYLWPFAIIAVGLFIIFRPRRRFASSGTGEEKKNPAGTGITEATIINESYDTPEDFVDSTSIFGGAKKNVISKNFRGGDLVSIFGGTEIDLTRADFNGTAVIELTTIFGGTKLVVPPNWMVKSEAVTIFGGMDDKRNMQTASTDASQKTLLLKGTVIFGGIEIKSY